MTPDADHKTPVTKDHSIHLVDLLAKRNVERIVLVGLATDHCVKTTALHGISVGFRRAVANQGGASVDLDEGDGERALAEVEAAGAELV